MLTNLTEEQMEYVLQHQLLGHLGCYAADTIYVVPICYAYDNKCIYGRTYAGMKLNMIRENRQVCFQVEHLENMAKWQSVICWGEFEELTDTGKRNDAIRILQERISVIIEDQTLHSSYWPFSISDFNHAAGIIFCIHVNKITGKMPEAMI
jgi:nitroimidazol reductase NimA-like FMN-containing flavoprotein (pyridoxamine 5'-phosphate oxidase superfamily)